MTEQEARELLEEIQNKVYEEDDLSGILVDEKEVKDLEFETFENFIDGLYNKVQYKGYTIYFDDYSQCKVSGRCFLKIRINDEKFAFFGYFEDSWGPAFYISDLHRYKEVTKTIEYQTLEQL